jgi:integrase
MRLFGRTLRKRDIAEKAGSWFFHFEYNEERAQKTVQSERDTPIHSAILPAVLARVAALKRDDALVFPSFPATKSHTLSRQLKTLCPPVGNVSPWHSFRHSFEWHAENVAKLRLVMIASLTGHNRSMYDTAPDHAQMVEAMGEMYVTGFGETTP